MSISSIFGSPSSSSRPLRSQYEYELSKGRDSHYSLPDRNMIPISVHEASAMTTSSAPFSTPFISLQRKEKQLQEDLQSLLDAQSAGLIAGLAGRPQDDASSNGSLTPTTSVVNGRPGRTMPVRQPAKTKIGLQGARRGISNTLRELADFKSEEGEIVEGNIGVRDGVLLQVDSWEQKRIGLERAIEDIESSEEGRKISELAEEAGKVDIEIKELETRLYEMRARHRALTAEISQVENSVQSKLSSYKASISIIDSQIRQFLAKPPLHNLQTSGEAPAPLPFALPVKRRTLDMAKEHWQAERERLIRRREEVQMEGVALDEGLIVWNDVITEVTTFEKRLRLEMQQMGVTNSAIQGSDGTLGDASSGMLKILESMEQTTLQIESKLRLAEAKNWSLLICCIGAELEAFKEGKEILQDALNISSVQNTPSQSDAVGVIDSDRQNVDEFLDHRSNEFHGQPVRSSEIANGSETEDDDPDPELLISHQDTN